MQMHFPHLLVKLLFRNALDFIIWSASAHMLRQFWQTLIQAKMNTKIDECLEFQESLHTLHILANVENKGVSDREKKGCMAFRVCDVCWRRS